MSENSEKKEGIESRHDAGKPGIKKEGIESKSIAKESEKYLRDPIRARCMRTRNKTKGSNPGAMPENPIERKGLNTGVMEENPKKNERYESRRDA